MAYEYFFLDETSIKKEERGNTKTRKMVFIGSQSELDDWLPEKGDDADFTFPVDNVRWAGAEFTLFDVSANALNRFEYDIRLIAKDYKDNRGAASNTEPNENLLEQTKSNVAENTFAITAKMAGYKLDPATNEYALDTTYVAATDNPFNEPLTIADINTVLKIDVFKYQRYLSGKPQELNRYRKIFTGVVTFAGFKGRAAGQNMSEVLGKDNQIYTEWNMTIQMPPEGKTWNPTWKGIK